MADITVTPADVSPANNAILRKGVLGEACSPGELVYQDGANGWKKADADLAASAEATGMVTGASSLGTTYPAGATVDILRIGAVQWGSGMTPGAPVYVSTTPGAGQDTAPAAASGDFLFIVGRAEAADVLFFNPQQATPVAQ